MATVMLPERPARDAGRPLGEFPDVITGYGPTWLQGDPPVSAADQVAAPEGDPGSGRAPDLPAKQVADQLWTLLEQAEAAEPSRRAQQLRRAGHLAVQSGMKPTDVDGDDLADELRWFAQGLALEAHAAAHPEVRPELAGVARALAEQLGHPAADRPDILARAMELARGDLGNDLDAREVLAAASGLLAST